MKRNTIELIHRVMYSIIILIGLFIAFDLSPLYREIFKYTGLVTFAYWLWIIIRKN